MPSPRLAIATACFLSLFVLLSARISHAAAQDSIVSTKAAPAPAVTPAPLLVPAFAPALSRR